MAQITQEQFFKKPEETIDEYNARIASLLSESPNETINASALTTTSTPDFQTSIPQQPVTSPSILEVPQVTKSEPTTSESAIDKLIADITAGQESTAKEARFRLEKEKEFGAPEAEQTIQDLSTQLKDLQREEKAIPLQVQEESIGRGRTLRAISGISEQRLRQNAIRALTISSSLDASQGLLASANRKVERAVIEEFGQKKAELEAKLSNLNLLLRSPALTREQKDRALQQQLTLKSQQDAIERNIKNKEEAGKKVNEIISLNKPTALQIEELRKLPDITSVLQKVQEFGLITSKQDITATQGSIEEFRLVFGRQPTSLAELNQFTASRGAAGREPSLISAPGLEIPTITGKPRTDIQNVSLGYAQRMADSNKTIEELGNQFTGKIGVITGSRFFPNIFKTEERQLFEQAQRNFINAVLRKESGAAISPSEFDSAAKQYFPQPGDSQAVLAQKTANRKRAISNLAQASNTSVSLISNETSGGNSYEDYLNAIK